MTTVYTASRKTESRYEKDSNSSKTDETTSHCKVTLPEGCTEMIKLPQDPKRYVREQNWEGLLREEIGKETKKGGHQDQAYFKADAMPWRTTRPAHTFQDKTTYPREDDEMPDSSHTSEADVMPNATQDDEETRDT